MRLLADQDVYALTTAFLRQLGHDVVTASESQSASLSDSEILAAAIRDNRILLTRDRDFGSLIFVNAIHAGVIYLRVPPSTTQAIHEELQRVLTQYDEEALLRSFVVVEPGRHRLRKSS
jgi:predicted nuclease of predicted toxin-antitoxin system